MLTTGLASQGGYGFSSAGALLSLVPITVVFLFLQRFFIAGSLAGAIKQYRVD